MKIENVESVVNGITEPLTERAHKPRQGVINIIVIILPLRMNDHT